MTTLYTPKELYADADELLSAAEYELRDEHEEFGSFLVCNNARLSITHYLIGFLIHNHVPVKAPATIASLQQQCQAFDPRFHSLQLDNIACRYETPGKEHCHEFEKVNACYQAAQQVRSIILSDSFVSVPLIPQ